MKRPLLVALAAVGPLCVALLRFLLPYYTAPDSTGAAADVAAHPGAQSLVLWLGLGAMMTLVPGLYALWARMPAGRLRDVAFSLTVVGYLCVPGLLLVDHVMWVGADQGLSASAVAGLADGVHLTALVQTGLFIPTHILGIVLIGVLALRSRIVPAAVGWALIVSQPLHFAAVMSSLPALDLVGWSLTALGSAWLAAVLVDDHEDPSLPTAAGGRTRSPALGRPRLRA